MESNQDKVVPLSIPDPTTAREGRFPRFPVYLVEAGLEALAAGSALASTIRAKDLTGSSGGYNSNKDKVDEAVVKRVEDAMAALQKALV